MLEGTVTALHIQAKNQRRVNVFLDGEFGFGLAKVLAARLRMGQLLEEADVESLKAKDAEEEAVFMARRWLGRRPYSRSEIQLRYRKKNVDDEVQTAALDQLTDQGLLDDQAFAEAWVENRSHFRPRSSRMLRSELRQKGVDRDAIEAALLEFDDEQAANSAAEQVFHRWEGLSEEVFRKKLSGYLSRRGFSYSTIRPVVEIYWERASGTESEVST